MINYFKYLLMTKWKYIVSTYILGIIFLIMVFSRIINENNLDNFSSILIILTLTAITVFVFLTTIYVSINILFYPLFKSEGVFDYSLPISTIKKQIVKILFILLYIGIGILLIIAVTYLVIGDYKNIITDTIYVFKTQAILNIITYVIHSIITINLYCIVCILLKPYIKTMFLNVFSTVFIVNIIDYFFNLLFFIVSYKIFGLRLLDFPDYGYKLINIVASKNYINSFSTMSVNIVVLIVGMVLTFYILDKVENKMLEV